MFRSGQTVVDLSDRVLRRALQQRELDRDAVDQLYPLPIAPTHPALCQQPSNAPHTLRELAIVQRNGIVADATRIDGDRGPHIDQLSTVHDYSQ